MPSNMAGRHVSVSPWAIPCATLCFLISTTAFVILVVYAPEDAAAYLSPLITSLTTFGGVAVLWWRSSRSQVQHSSENAVIIQKTDQAAVKAGEASDKAEIAVEAVESRLNGDLDRRITAAIETALNKHNM